MIGNRRIDTLTPQDFIAVVAEARRISLLHLRGVRWARIAEFVGQRDLTVTANTYTHVLVDEAEIDYAQLLS